MPDISSIHNPRIQSLRELLSKRSSREEQGAFVVEGVRLAEEALLHGGTPDAIYYAESLSDRGRKVVEDARARGTSALSITDDVLKRISETENSQGILLVAPIPSSPLPAQLDYVLVLDQVRDPGNAGTMLRTAAAAGIQAVFSTPGTTDLFAPKVVRSGMGAHFRLNIKTFTWNEIVKTCKERQKPLSILLAESGEGEPLWQQDLRRPVAIVIGGEAEGAGAEARRFCDAFVRIPMPGQFESLNAAVAGAIFLFEGVRQRSA